MKHRKAELCDEETSDRRSPTGEGRTSASEDNSKVSSAKHVTPLESAFRGKQ